MQVTLTLLTGPEKGLAFAFSQHDTFLVGRSKNSHFQLPVNDKSFSRLHFMVEVNPPRCRIVDLGSRNGTYVNGQRIIGTDLKDGDQIRAGQTTIGVKVRISPSEEAIAIRPELVDMPFMPKIAGYVPLRELANGCLGRLYLAATTPKDELRAIQILRPREPGTQAHVDQLLEDAGPLLKLRHANIAPLLELGVGRHHFHCVYDYLSGADAAELLEREGPLAVDRALAWIDPLLAALDFAHGLGLTQRDVKPSRVRIVEEAGREKPIWCVFGLNRIFAASPLSGLAGLGDLTAQAPYWPPELLADFKNPTPAGDQYAAAALLYFFLTRAHPFDLPTVESRRYSVLLKQQTIPLRDRRPDIPEEIAAVAQRALSRQPGQRFANVGEFRQALLRSRGA